jgi:hypothetical protein
MITREFQLLLHCARSQPDAEPIIDLVNAGPNWQRLLEIAKQHGVRPMLRRGLKLACWDAVPRTTQLELDRFIRANLHKNLSLTGELFRLLDAFQKNDIRIVPFKGPILADSVHGHLSLREFSDLDVMVRQENLCEAEDILAACGYVAQFPDRDYRSTFVSYHGQYAFSHGETGFCVDLHWQLSSKGVAFPVQTAEVWPKLRQVTFAGRRVLTLADDDLVLFLAGHGTKEGWRRLIWVADFAERLRRCQDMDWAELLDRVHRSHSSRSLLLAIDLASTLLDAPAPPNLIGIARANSAVRALSEKARLRMLSTVSQGELTEFLESLNTHDLLRHRLWPVVTLLTTRTVGDHQAMPLPKSLWSTYYLIRPLRLMCKATKMMVSNNLSRAVKFTKIQVWRGARLFCRELGQQID